MTTYELWHQIMEYGDFDRIPVIHWGEWKETRERWLNEGLPADIKEHDFFRAEPFWRYLGGPCTPDYMRLYPAFEEKSIEENDEFRIFRNDSGVIVQTSKTGSCVPHSIDFTLKTAEDWPEYRKRLMPDPARIPENWDERVETAESSGLPVCFPVGSLMGWIRDWMGVENMCYLFYDSPECYQDMVDTISDLACWALDNLVPRMKNPPSLCFIWEDICGSSPFVSPAIFNQYTARGYRKIRKKMDELKIPYFCVDSDGNVEELIPSWLDAGVNILFPVEPGTWGASPEKFRQMYGKNLRMVGGFNKLVLEKDKKSIDEEIDKHVPLLQQGGYVMMPDHVITPGTPLENYQYYLDRIRNLRFKNTVGK